jgi:hypothetical protein
VGELSVCRGYITWLGWGTLSVHLSIDIVTIRTIVTGVQGREPFTLMVGGGATTNLECVS